jgi:hypothetical protein
MPSSALYERRVHLRTIESEESAGMTGYGGDYLQASPGRELRMLFSSSCELDCEPAADMCECMNAHVISQFQQSPQ